MAIKFDALHHHSKGGTFYPIPLLKPSVGKGFANERDVKKRRYIPAHEINPKLPYWLDGALKKATHPKVTKRYDTLSAFIVDIKKPNPAFTRQTIPLLKRNPTAFWRGFALLLLLLNLLQLLW